MTKSRRHRARRRRIGRLGRLANRAARLGYELQPLSRGAFAVTADDGVNGYTTLCEDARGVAKHLRFLANLEDELAADSEALP